MINGYQDPAFQFALSRLINENGSAEGSNLPPRYIGLGRVPLVKGLRVARIESIAGGTQLTLVWENPDPQEFQVDHFNIYVSGLISSGNLIGPTTAQASPGVVTLQNTDATNVTIYVQTQLSNGMVSDLNFSPTVGVRLHAPETSTSTLIGSLGNQFGASIIASPTFTLGSALYYFVDASGAPSFTLLPLAQPHLAGLTYMVVKTDGSGNGVNITPVFPQLINGLPTFQINVPLASSWIFTNGANWFTK